jgi:hypothetical protein
MGKKRSWEYAKRMGDKAICELCYKDENNKYRCVDGITGCLIKQLKIKHNIKRNRRLGGPIMYLVIQ